MNTIEEISEKLHDYVKENTFAKNKTFDGKTMLFKDGFFDSMGFVLLIDFLEENFNVTTDDEDMIEENFESIDAIIKYIQSKQSN